MVELVAEVTTNHMGNLNVLLAMVDAAARAGADSIKMQKKDVETFYSREKLDAPYLSPYGATYREYRKMFEFNAVDWQRFDKRCRERGLPWFGTGQDIPSLAFLVAQSEDGLQRYKVSSSNARNQEYLQAMAHMLNADSEIVLSVGGSTLKDIATALGVLRKFKRIWLLHCVAQYPCPVADLRLGNIQELGRQFGTDRIRVGYSGHEEGWEPSLVAARLGAEMIERHFCLSRHSFVHHIECSLTPDEFAAMRKAIERKDPCPVLPHEAYRVEFGMSAEESIFLERQTYANDRLGLESRLADRRVRACQGAQ